MPHDMLTGTAGGGRRFFARLFDDHLVVIDRRRREMRVLNPTATALWLLLEDRPCTVAALVTEIAALFDAGSDAGITAGVESCLDDWVGTGWAVRRGGGMVELADEAEAPAPLPVVRPAGPGESLPDAPLFAVRFGLNGMPLALEMGVAGTARHAGLLPRLRAVLGGFPSAPGAAETRLRLVAADERIWIDTPAGLVWTSDPSDAFSHLVMHLFLAGYPRARVLATLHAAALGRDGGMVVMPGPSGSGKSTLTGHLVSRGWRYGGDDIIAIGTEDGGPPLVLPFTSALSVKPGSWPVLGRVYPEVATLPLVPYSEKLARFLPLPPACHAGPAPEGRRPRAIVFPRFDPGSPGTLEPMSMLDCVLELGRAGFTTGLHLEGDRLDRLFDLLDGLPRYRLSYPCLETAERCLSGLVP